MSTYYADTIGNITVTNNIVRIDFVTQAVPISVQQVVQFQPGHQLIMPLDGFLYALGLQEQLRAKLVSDGVLKFQQNDSESAVSATAEADVEIPTEDSLKVNPLRQNKSY